MGCIFCNEPTGGSLMCPACDEREQRLQEERNNVRRCLECGLPLDNGEIDDLCEPCWKYENDRR